MSATYQISGKYGETIILVKGEADTPAQAYQDFVVALSELGHVEAENALRTVSRVLNHDPLAAATATAVTAFPGAQVQQAPAAESWGNPPVPAMQYPAAAAAPPPPAYQPPAAAAAPAGAAPVCQHGARVFKSGEKNGRTWTAWFCPAAKGDPTQCKAQFG